MTSIAQGKRSDTLGKPPHHITPRPARAKANITRYVSVLLPLQGVSSTAHYTQGVASLALGYELLPPRISTHLTEEPVFLGGGVVDNANSPLCFWADYADYVAIFIIFAA